MDDRKKIVIFIVIIIVLGVFWLFGAREWMGGVRTIIPQPSGESAGEAVPETQGAVTVVPDASRGEYLGDAAGMALYTTTKETCDGACLTVWPPYTAQGESTASGRLGARMNDAAGVFQYTWDGKFLYYYNGDTKVGDANGHGLGGAWSLVQQ